ncbi:MAG: transposase, partial [Actinomycetia bacterium]|nr:transposase [Actinomycetes bacterium]
RDRGSQFIDAFDEIFRTEGLKILKTPVRTPVANTFAQRWIGTLRRELLDRTIIWNQHQTERPVFDYIDHYNTHRPHRSLSQHPPRPAIVDDDPADTPKPARHVVRTSRCDGLIHEYRKAAGPHRDRNPRSPHRTCRVDQSTSRRPPIRHPGPFRGHAPDPKPDIDLTRPAALPTTQPARPPPTCHVCSFATDPTHATKAALRSIARRYQYLDNEITELEPLVRQAAPNLLMGWDRAIRFVIRDGAGQYTRAFDNVFAAVGGSVITIPPGAPQAIAFAERWVRTIRHELLDRTLIWNQGRLQRLLEHYNEHRPHRSLNQRAPTDAPDTTVVELGHPIQRTTTCAGLINEYRPAA